MQIDGYSLDAQKSRMKAFCEFNDYEMAGEYEDAGKSGKSIEGRVAFDNMMEDIKSWKDDASLIRRIIQNPVYCGKIAYGRRRTEKVHGTRNDYRQVYKDDYLLVDGLHEAIVSEEVWEQAQECMETKALNIEKMVRSIVIIFIMDASTATWPEVTNVIIENRYLK